MSLVDPYSPCPCGSGNKFKWCCQKAESYLDRARRLAQTGQIEAAIAAVDEGLAKFPTTPLLSIHKALLLVELKDYTRARECLETLLKQSPGLTGVEMMLFRMVLVTDGTSGAIELAQKFLAEAPQDLRANYAACFTLISQALARREMYPGAYKHLEFADSLVEGKDGEIRNALAELKAEPNVAPWVKQPYRLYEAPEELTGPTLEDFDKALDLADEGLWQEAATRFELLTGNPKIRPFAEHNLAICRLWLGEDAAAVALLAQWLKQAKPTSEAVSLASLCAAMDEADPRDPLEVVRLSWSVRSREALLKAFSERKTVVPGSSRPLDPDKEDSPMVNLFHWLDRPVVEARDGLTREEIPLIRAEILLGTDTVMLEFTDDGRLDSLIDEFPALTGNSVPPAHPRTKVVGQMNREHFAISWHWYLPPELSEGERERLNQEQVAYLMSKVWPQTPLAALGGKSPEQVAQAGDQPLLLAGQLNQVEFETQSPLGVLDWNALRSSLKVSAPPQLDPATVNIDALYLIDFNRVDLSKLDDDRLTQFLKRAKEWGLISQIRRAGRELVNRPDLVRKLPAEAASSYAELASDAVERKDWSGAAEFLRLGRQIDATATPRLGDAFWDMEELGLATAHEPPERWVPTLNEALQRHGQNEKAMSLLTMRLVSLGLLQIVPAPDTPEGVMIDSRILQRLLDLYAPKIAQPSSYLGVSATKGEIWTPGSESKGSGIWTPGSDAGASAGGEKPKIIVTGR